MSNKTISINPDLFSFTKKKRAPKKDLQPRAPSQNNKNKTVRRNHVLKFIRNEQEKNYRKLLNGDAQLQTAALDEEDVDFKQSLDYLMSLAQDETAKQQQQSQNHTLRHRPTLQQQQESFPGYLEPSSEFVSMVMPDEMTREFKLIPPVAPPQWGCLRNGNLPTYRSWKNATQKNRGGGAGAPPVAPLIQQHQQQQPYFTTPVYNPKVVAAQLGATSQGMVQPVNDWLLEGGGKGSEIRQTMDLAQKMKPPLLPKQQRTVRRTYHVGKSKSQVSVLVSNKTIRNRVQAKTHEIRQKPMEDVKRFLIQKGFVRVGTTAPNDVLRKMYESAQLICGEIQNHNPENLLFNFLHTSNK
jgi:hypothetical protein